MKRFLWMAALSSAVSAFIEHPGGRHVMRPRGPARQGRAAVALDEFRQRDPLEHELHQAMPHDAHEVRRRSMVLGHLEADRQGGVHA